MKVAEMKVGEAMAETGAQETASTDVTPRCDEGAALGPNVVETPPEVTAAVPEIAARSDSRIRYDLLRELEWDTRLLNAPVRVDVAGGVVTLTGAVTSYDKALAAVRAAGRVPGVRDVVNRIWVDPPAFSPHTDRQVAGVVGRALAREMGPLPDCLRCSVADGWVTVEGRVATPADQARVEHVVQYVVGVRGLTNRVAIQAPDGAPPRRSVSVSEGYQ
ncbi:MAG: BON domain-containing protein [Armatimonadetes bacterium]|nr:BON domain-containing protein [Armatimonadota bacterium]